MIVKEKVDYSKERKEFFFLEAVANIGYHARSLPMSSEAAETSS